MEVFQSECVGLLIFLVLSEILNLKYYGESIKHVAINVMKANKGRSVETTASPPAGGNAVKDNLKIYLLIALIKSSYKLNGNKGSGSSRKYNFNVPVNTWTSSKGRSPKLTFWSSKILKQRKMAMSIVT